MLRVSDKRRAAAAPAAQRGGPQTRRLVRGRPDRGVLSMQHGTFEARGGGIQPWVFSSRGVAQSSSQGLAPKQAPRGADRDTDTDARVPCLQRCPVRQRPVRSCDWVPHIRRGQRDSRSGGRDFVAQGPPPAAMAVLFAWRALPTLTHVSTYPPPQTAIDNELRARLPGSSAFSPTQMCSS